MSVYLLVRPSIVGRSRALPPPLWRWCATGYPVRFLVSVSQSRYLCCPLPRQSLRCCSRANTRRPRRLQQVI